MNGPITLGRFLQQEFPNEEPLLGDFLLQNSLGMIFGPRGSGKSWVALLLCFAVASTKSRLKPWGLGYGKRVVYFDGEMRAEGLQNRLKAIHAYLRPESKKEVSENLMIVSRAMLSSAIGSLDDVAGQKAIERFIPHGTSLIVIDNLSAWSSGGREDGASWATIKMWLLEQRLKNRAVVLVHHAGKNGQQRGSSAHEDLLDFSLMVSPLDSEDAKSTKLELRHTKLRDHHPSLKGLFHLEFKVTDQKFTFSVTGSQEESDEFDAQLRAWRADGLSVTTMAKRTGLHKSTISRHLQRLFSEELHDSNAS